MRVSPRLVGVAVGGAIALAAAFVLPRENGPGGPHRVAYPDIAGGPWTICTGHTRGVREGDTATLEQCAKWLQEDLFAADAIVGSCIYAPLTDNERAAFDSLTFNAGASAVCGSTLQRKANTGDIAGACREILRWDYAGGKRLRGLTLRRLAEFRMCWPDFSNVIAG